MERLYNIVKYGVGSLKKQELAYYMSWPFQLSLRNNGQFRDEKGRPDRYKFKQLLTAGSAAFSQGEAFVLSKTAGSYHRDALLTILNDDEVTRASHNDPESYL